MLWRPLIGCTASGSGMRSRTSARTLARPWRGRPRSKATAPGIGTTSNGVPAGTPVQLGAMIRPQSDPIVPSSDLRKACRLAHELPAVIQATESVKMSVRRSFELVRGQMIRASLAQIPLARVKDVTAGRLRLGALESNGFATIQQVLDTSPSRLTLVPGVGEQTAQQVFAAAQQLAKAAADDLRFRINLDPADRKHNRPGAGAVRLGQTESGHVDPWRR